MTTYNTGNPIGSTDPRDLYDNAQNLDTAMHTAATTWADRLGNSRPSWAGATGYQSLGDYAAGIQVTTYNQVIRASGEYWRAAAGTVLPYTTTGAGMPESGKFVSVGDAMLRADLVDGDGSSLVGFQQSGTGSVVRTAQDKMREWVSVKDFGASGDGVADDTASIQAAAAATLPGQKLYFPAGVYVVENVMLRHDVEGAGVGVTRILHKPGASTVAFQVRNSCRISNLTVDGNKANQTNRLTCVTANGTRLAFDRVEFINTINHAVNVQDFSFVSFTSCYFRGMAQHGGTVGQQTMAVLLNCTVKGTAVFSGCEFVNDEAPTLSAPGGVLCSTTNITLIADSCYFRRIGQGRAGNLIGCFDHYWEGVVTSISNCVFEEICYSAIKVSSCRYVNISNITINSFNPAGSDAIPAIVCAYRNGSPLVERVSISGVICGGTFGSGKSGIEVYGAAGNLIKTVSISDCTVDVHGAGYLVQYAENVQLRGLSAKTVAGRPFDTRNLAGASLKITDATILAPTIVAFRVSEGCTGADVTITNAQVRGSNIANSVFIEGIGAVTFTNNAFSDTAVASTAIIRNITGDAVISLNRADANLTLTTPSGIGGTLVNANNAW